LSANLQLYEQSVIQFLQSCTIVFSPLANQINNNLLAQGIEIDQTQPDTWKYYLNLSGQYFIGPNSSAPVDTMMTILSLDTKQPMNYTVANLAISPKTTAAYVIGSSYYTALCQTYPTQTDLIKSIRYPVNLNTALDASDFTLVGWGDGYLESTEQEAILYELNIFLTYATTRWYFSFLNYEVYYAWAFWACLWQSLPNAIFAARLKYLHTASAHSFHIWSYLQSRGIGDYSDILTSQQALFLYRNLNYLIQNKGKQSTLVLLVNELLDSVNVGLVGKTIYMNTATNADICAWTPEFVSTIVPTNNAQSLELVAPESMTMINTELVSAGLDNNSTTAYIAAQQTQIGLTPLNILPTKLVEIQKVGVDQKYGSLLNTFILDTLVWAITSGLYTPSIVITDPTTNITLSLSGKDALALYYYAVHRSGHEQPVNLPSVYSPTCAFLPNITAASFPKMFSYNGKTYPTQSYLSIDALVAGLGYPPIPTADPETFATMVADLFLVLIKHVRYSRTEDNKIALEMFLHYCKTIMLQTTPYNISLTTASNYTTWAAMPNVHATSLFTQLEAQSDYVDAYIALATTIMSSLLPEDNPIYTFFAYTTASTDNLYDRLRSLFVQLCSYNICFLDTNRVNAWWFLNDKVIYEIASSTHSQSLAITVVTDAEMGVQTDVLSIPGIELSSEIALGSIDIVPIIISEQDTVSISTIDTCKIEVPLTVMDTKPYITDTIHIAFHTGLGATVIAPTS